MLVHALVVESKGDMKQHGRFFKVELTIWLDERVCMLRLPDGTECTDPMAVYEALVVETEYEGWVLDWEETEMSLTDMNERAT